MTRLLFPKEVTSGAKLYIAGVILVGIPILGVSLIHSITRVDSAWMYLLALVIFAGLFPIKIPLPIGKSESFSLTVGDMFMLVGLLTFGPHVAVVLNAVEGAISSLRVRVKHTYKFLFNLSSLALVTFLLGQILHNLIGTSSPYVSAEFPGTVRLLAEIALCAIIYFVLNSTSVAIAISLSAGQSALVVWRRGLLRAVPIKLVNGFTAGILLLLSVGQAMSLSLALSFLLVGYYGIGLWLRASR